MDGLVGRLRTVLCLIGIVIGILAIGFLLLSVGALILLISIYSWKKPQILADSKQGKTPKWWWLFFISTNTLTEIGAIMVIFLLINGIGSLVMGTYGAVVQYYSGSAANYVGPYFYLVTGLLFMLIGVVLGYLLVKRESYRQRSNT